MRFKRHIILARLLARKEEGKSLALAEITREDKLLARSIRKQRGGWSGVLSEIGEDPARWKPYHTWTPEELLERIRIHAANGTLRYGRVMKEDESFPRAARRFFGSWESALTAAGLNVELYRGRHVRRQWSPEAVRLAIAARVEAGLPITTKAICRADSGLYRAGCIFFGSWKRALNRNASPVHDPRRRTSNDDIIALIRNRHAQGLPVSQAKIQPRSFVGLVNSRFGRWSNALRAAGLDPDKINLHGKWSSEKIVETIRHRFQSGVPVNSGSIRRGKYGDSRLYDAGVHYFGTWDKALSAAGISPSTVRLRRRWSAEKVLAEIRRMAHAGERFYRMADRSDTQALLQASSRYFGSWTNARIAAGLGTSSSYRPWTRSSIIKTLREYGSQGIPFKHLPSSFERASSRLFGSWNAALKAAFGDGSTAYWKCPKPRDCPRQESERTNRVLES